ncbi:CPCC family cysteine-rich protein [Hymenobacter psoromatis]|uniref:CPCC family cysteine-rich protein n=1 Tax=Hymenobacter psoromatis TaxID=1484116 RepID=UPI001CC18BA2|nr:CPCC family cysteine-rich protein [Hymenobacter psoromatis]
MHAQNKAGWFQCPCCKHFTLPEGKGNTFEICPVCFWEDDGIQSSDPTYSGGANECSLNEAQSSFCRISASEAVFIQSIHAPFPDELPDVI